MRRIPVKDGVYLKCGNEIIFDTSGAPAWLHNRAVGLLVTLQEGQRYAVERADRECIYLGNGEKIPYDFAYADDRLLESIAARKRECSKNVSS